MSQPIGALVTELSSLGVRLWVESGQLRFRAPQGVMTEELRTALRARRAELESYLDGGGLPPLTADPDGRYEAFPLSDVQSAYLLGRGRTFAYGGVACHGYGELRYPELDPQRMTEAWRAVIDRHDMLRAVVEVDGSQRVLPEVPAYQVDVVDVRGRPGAEVAAAVEAVRAEMDHRSHQVDTWPLFEVRITLADDHAVMHVSIDFLIADFVSIQVLLAEVHQYYHRPDEPLPPLEITFRDYLLTERQVRSGANYERDRAYWHDRIDELPAAPELPVLTAVSDAPPRFRRWQTTVDTEMWAGLRQRAGRNDVSPSGAVLAAFAEVIANWSRHPRFTLDVTLLNRLPLHPQVPSLIGDFTSVELLAVDATPTSAFGHRAKALQAQLWQDMDHRTFSGVEVMREITRRRGVDAALFPVVFTSAIGLTDAGGELGEFDYGISQTPQVWIDCQNMERDGTLATNWDVREGVFPDGLVDAAFEAFQTLLHRLATDDAAWRELHPVALPDAQARLRAEVNDTAAPVPDGLLHERVVAQALSTPDRMAVLAANNAMTYGDLLARAVGVAERLLAEGCQPGELMGITMDRGVEQVVGVLAILLAGGVYVPVDTNQPAARRDQILAGAGIHRVLTQSWLTGSGWPDEVRTVAVDLVPPTAPRAMPVLADPADLAYVIHTSGSTGVPKGVMISHRSALNTVVDINTRFEVGQDDRVLALSHLGFDLSVYDVFGPLSVGGALVIPAQDRPGDPSHWADLVAEHSVTVWNSVPAQLQMLHDYLAATPTVSLPTLRLAMLSGDWIPVALPDGIRQRIPSLRVVSLGGATEASIWSIHYPIGEVAPDWRSIPYGRPLANQSWHVLDAAGHPCPDWVAGELFIGGVGVAMGYLGDESRTAERFPVLDERLYRTGDFGRYLPDGDLEILGREDSQVKIRGYRIELAEIENAVAAHPAIGNATVIVTGDRPLERRLAAFAEPAPRPATECDNSYEQNAIVAGDKAIAAVDRARYLRFAEALDAVALPAMVRAFQASGLFLDPADQHSYTDILTAAKVSPRHHRLVRRWLRALTEHGVLEGDRDGYQLTGSVDLAWSVVRELALPEDSGLLDYFRTSTEQLPALLRGDDDPLALLFPEGRLDVSQDLYEQAVFNRWANSAAAAVVRDIADRRESTAPLRILEVGAGGGGTTAAVLSTLDGVEVDYLCTDLSPFFLTTTQNRFADQPGIRFGVYDLNREFRAQGLIPNSFDIVVAGDVLHATTDVDQVLAGLRELLAPGGWLVALEMTREHLQIMTSLELLVRLDESVADFTDQRQGTDQVFLSRDSWLSVLDQAGGRGCHCLPAPDGFIGELGMCVLTAQFKTDRSPVDLGALTDWLRERVPEYMLPATIQVIDALPLTGNGKIDRKALHGWLPRRTSDVVSIVDAGPVGDLERRVAQVWAQALNLDQIGRDDNLFAVGGDSLVAAQIVGRLLEEIPEATGLFFDELLRQLLEQPTIAALTGNLVPATPEPVEEAHGPTGTLVRLDTTENDGDTVCVLLRDAAVPSDTYQPLVSELAADGPVFGLHESQLPLALLAAEHAMAISAAGHRRARLVGHGDAAMLAVEVARVLTEGGGVVDGVTLIAPTFDVTGGHEPTLYAGDLTVIRSTEAEDLTVWEDICLGDLRIVEVPAAAAELLHPAHVGAAR